MSSINRADIWFAVVNSFAASKKATALWKSAEKLLKEREVTFHGVRTGSAGNAAETGEKLAVHRCDGAVLLYQLGKTDNGTAIGYAEHKTAVAREVVFQKDGGGFGIEPAVFCIAGQGLKILHGIIAVGLQGVPYGVCADGRQAYGA